MAASTASAEAAGTMATSLPSLATWSGSRPSISQAAWTGPGIGMVSSRKVDAHPRGRRDLVEGRRQPAARRVAKDADVRTGRHDGRHQPVERLRVRGDLHLEAQALADAHDGDAVQPDRTGEDDGVAGGRPIRADGDARGHEPDAGGVDEETVGRSPIDDLRVAGHDSNAGPSRGPGDRFGDPPQLVDRQAFLDDVGERQRQRLGAHHGQVVDRAVDGQLADVAARELERADDERVGGESEPLAEQVDHGRVVERPRRARPRQAPGR